MEKILKVSLRKNASDCSRITNIETFILIFFPISLKIGKIDSYFHEFYRYVFPLLSLAAERGIDECK